MHSSGSASRRAALAALAALLMLAGACGVRPNNLRSPSTAPAGVPASPTAPVPPPDGASNAPERSTTSRGPFPPAGPVDAGP